ncbi:uncharacterized protein A4U43_C01F4050 [Asparagus officinalis]|uniref:Homeobox domain-containing protein n=1 Tax=Asparagus officinalis TaxID=4686 RepID=A0A5P1FR72_ASPOF|nr:uncharacterized protein A4U43_C01F4050 [Asparagus officinalis]
MGGFGISPLGLELTMAVPGSMSSSSVSEGVGYNITRDLDINLPASEEMVETQKEALASRLRLKPRQVEVWFQNRRARTKLKQTEMECEYLKRCFGSLSQENKRLQREVEELRAMRVTPPTILSPQTRLPIPASALTMCPRCQRVTTAAPSAQNRRDGRRPLARGYIVVEC